MNDDSFVTTVSAESMSMEDATQSIKGDVRSLSDLFMDGASDSSLDFFACSSTDLKWGRTLVTPRSKDMLRNHERRGTGTRTSKGAVGSISDLLDSSDSCDFDEFQLTSTLPLKKAVTPRRSRREKVTKSRGAVHPPSEKLGVNLMQHVASPSSKMGLGSYLAKNNATGQNSIIKDNVKVNKDLSQSALVKTPVHGNVTKNRRNDAPPRGAKRLPSIDNTFMDSWQSKSSDSCNSNRKTPLNPYLQAAYKEPVKGCDASVVSEISGISWSSGVSSLSMSSCDDSIAPDFCRGVRDENIRHSLDDALQGSFNFIEDAVPRRPARRRTPSPSRRRPINSTI